MTELAMAGKIAPRPFSPLRRSLTKATAAATARWRARFGKNGSTSRKTTSIASKRTNHDRFWCGAVGRGRLQEEFVDADSVRIARRRLQRLQDEERHDHGARPVGDLVEVKGK